MQLTHSPASDVASGNADAVAAAASTASHDGDVADGVHTGDSAINGFDSFWSIFCF